MPTGRLIELALVVALLFPSSAFAAQSAELDGAVVKTVETALGAAQSGNVAELSAQYLPDCTFVDEFAPFYWSGPNAINAYFTSAAQMYKDTKMTGTKVAHGAPKYVYVGTDSAYVAVPLRVRAEVNGKPYKATGTLTFTLRKISATWKIASQSWTKETENINPY